MKIRREVKLGILAVITLFLFVWGINYLKGRDIFKKQLGFFVVYDEVTGLIASNPVSLNGVAIGQVKRIFFHPDRSGRVVVECLISDQIDIPSNSTAVLASVGLIGAKEIEIRLGDSPALLSSGDTLPGLYQPALQDELARQFMPMKDQAESLLGKMDTVLTAISQVMTPAAREDLSAGIGNLAITLERLGHTSMVLDTTLSSRAGELGGILDQTATVTRTIGEHNAEIARMLQNFSGFSDTLAAMELSATVEQARKAMAELAMTMERINSGEGSLGLLLNDPGLYVNLETSSRQLELLLEDIRENPGKYFTIRVFGR